MKRSKSRGRIGDCWLSGKVGHTKKDCYSYKKAWQKVKKKANVVYEHDDSVLVLSLCEITSNLWVLDSGASFHATSCMDAFLNYQEGQFENAYLGDKKSLEIIGKGDVLLQSKNGGTWLLQDVRHVPKLKKNLISISQLFSQGCNTFFFPDSWKVTKGALQIANGDRVGSLYIF